MKNHELTEKPIGEGTTEIPQTQRLPPPVHELLKFAAQGWKSGKTRQPMKGRSPSHWLLAFDELLQKPDGITLLREYAKKAGSLDKTMIDCIHRAFDYHGIENRLRAMIREQLAKAIMETKGGYYER